MKLIVCSLIALVSLMVVSLAHAKETRITGAEAEKMYQELNVPETFVQDEHGGTPYAVAKYGKAFGCEKSLDDGRVECWRLE